VLISSHGMSRLSSPLRLLHLESCRLALGANPNKMLALVTREGLRMTVPLAKPCKVQTETLAAGTTAPSATAQLVHLSNNSSTLLIGASSTKQGCLEMGAGERHHGQDRPPLGGFERDDLPEHDQADVLHVITLRTLP
jgi:hypothetical protein